MDRLIAVNSVPFGSADTAPATGTPQYATSGNPATSTPATLFPAYAWNMLQDEIYNVIISAGLTPDRNAWNQLLTAIQTMLKGQARGLYLGSQTITSSTTYTPGTYTVGGLTVTATKSRFHGVAPGGGSGGCIATSSSQAAGSAGGSAGNPFDFWVVSGLAAMSVTFGAAGAAGAPGANNGGNGGDIVIGSIATIKGGKGGSAGNASNTFPSLTNPCISNAVSTISSAGGMTLAGIVNGIGQTAVRGILLSSGAILYSAGGNTAYGSGGTVDQAAATGYGSGAVGNGIGASTAASAGFPGAPGILTIDEYA